MNSNDGKLLTTKMRGYVVQRHLYSRLHLSWTYALDIKTEKTNACRSWVT